MPWMNVKRRRLAAISRSGSCEDLSKHDRDLSAGEIRPGQVRTTAEADVLVGCDDVEAIGIGEDGFVTVPVLEEQQLVALGSDARRSRCRKSSCDA
jgi:hypothetical protein